MISSHGLVLLHPTPDLSTKLSQQTRTLTSLTKKRTTERKTKEMKTETKPASQVVQFAFETGHTSRVKFLRSKVISSLPQENTPKTVPFLPRKNCPGLAVGLRTVDLIRVSAFRNFTHYSPIVDHLFNICASRVFELFLGKFHFPVAPC